MEYSSNFGFNLPSSSAEDIADIDKISDNFRIIDGEMVTNEDVKGIVDTKANLEFVDLEIEELAYVSGLKEGAHIYELEKIIEAGSSGAYELYFTDGTQLITSAHDSFKVGKKYLISTTLDPENGYIFDIVAEVIDLEDKVNIEDIDQTYNPKSPNAQSGIAVAEALSNVGGGGKGTLTTIANITLTEEVNSVICADANSFADIGKVGDFYIKITIPMHSTKVAGHLFLYINNRPIIRVENFDTGYGYECVNQFYSINIPNVSRINMGAAKFSANEATNINLTTTSATINEPVSNITVGLGTASSMLPIGTNIRIVGWVE